MNTQPLFTLSAWQALVDAFGFKADIRLALYYGIGYPLPEVGEDAPDQPLARQVGTFAHIGHPILWLKGDILKPHTVVETRYRDPDSDDEWQRVASGEKHIEMENEIAARIAAHLEFSRVYSSKTGQWVDVVADIMDLDVRDPFVSTRIRKWQDGAPDELFDNFDLQDHMAKTIDQDEVMQFVEVMFPVSAISCTLAATLQAVQFLSDPSNQLTIERRVMTLMTVGYLLDTFSFLLNSSSEDMDELEDITDKISAMPDNELPPVNQLEELRSRALSMAVALTEPLEEDEESLADSLAEYRDVLTSEPEAV
jgi:hypothetical protein